MLYPTHLAHFSQLVITQNFQLFVGPIPVLGPSKAVSLPAEGFIPIFFLFSHFPFPLQPVTLPKHKPEPIKI